MASKYNSKNLLTRTVLVLILAICSQFIPNQSELHAQGFDTLAIEHLFQPPYLAGVRPSVMGFNVDQDGVFIRVSPKHNDNSDTYLYDIATGDTVKAGDNMITRFDRSPNGEYIAYIKDGDLFLQRTDGSDVQQITETPDDEYSITWSPNSKRLAFIKDGDVWVYNIAPFKMIQVTDLSDDEPSYYIDAWAGDNDHLIVRQYNDKNQREVYFPEYLGQFVKPGASKRGLSEVTVKQIAVDSVSSRLLKQGTFWLRNVEVGLQGQQVVLDIIDPDMKTRELYVANVKSGEMNKIYSYNTDGWVNYTLAEISYSPDGQQLMMLSERDGWSHIYLVDPDNGETEQITRGEYEVVWSRWLDNERILYSSSEVDLGERHLYIYDLDENRTKKITQRPGFRDDFELSDDKEHLVYQYTYWNTPEEIYYLNLKALDENERKLTDTTPERFSMIGWQKPNLHRFTGRDGETEVSMTVLEPRDRDPQKEYPLVVFVHGAGSLQNVYKGWSESYYREYMFNQWLTSKGYAVMQVDFRHSTGYGRDFREDVTNWMGKYEMHDIIDAIDETKDKYAYVDTSRVGIYGGSYGGFLALYAVSVAPDRFDAAAALRAVTNWRNYYYANPWYTRPRLGTPEEFPEHYDRSSPLTYADSLSQPVYLLHGLIDSNVGFQDAVQYIERLVQSGNTEFDVMFYPSERHSFSDPDAWEDEYRRIYELYEEHLKN